MVEVKAVLVFKWPVCLIPFSFPALNITSPPYFTLYTHSHAFGEWNLGDILDLMLFGLLGCCKKQGARTTAWSKKGRIWQ